MNRYLIALGSNMGERARYLEQACRKITEKIGPIQAAASLYQTAPVGNAKYPFLNSAIICQTRFEASQVLSILLDIELALDRTRIVHWGDRTIDLDIILWRNSDGQFPKVDSENLKIPHQRCLERDFVLVPACEIAGHWLHPLSQRPLGEHLKELKITTIQKKMEVNQTSTLFFERNIEKD